MSRGLAGRARPLPVLAGEIRAEVEAAEADFRSAVRHAVRAGELLAEAKAQVKHGEWLPWLRENFPGDPRTAQRYMQVAANASRVSHLPTMREAVALLSEPRGNGAKAPAAPPGQIPFADEPATAWARAS